MSNNINIIILIIIVIIVIIITNIKSYLTLSYNKRLSTEGKLVEFPQMEGVCCINLDQCIIIYFYMS